MSDKTHVTGSDPADGADPGGTHSTRPGNPDKSGPSKPGGVDETVGGSERPDALRREPGSHRDGP